MVLTKEELIAALQHEIGEIDMFGTKLTRGSALITLILNAHAAYRMQLFCYLKSCGREELNTMNLWSGMDGPA